MDEKDLKNPSNPIKIEKSIFPLQIYPRKHEKTQAKLNDTIEYKKRKQSSKVSYKLYPKQYINSQF